MHQVYLRQYFACLWMVQTQRAAADNKEASSVAAAAAVSRSVTLNGAVQTPNVIVITTVPAPFGAQYLAVPIIYETLLMV